MTRDDLIAALEKAGLRFPIIEEGECWNWGRAKDHAGRGRLWVNGKITLAHRAVWATVNGPIPDGRIICHHCDNPTCIRPAHLYAGTHQDNVSDMMRRQRHRSFRDPAALSQQGRELGLANNWARGSGNPKAKLTEGQVAEIRDDRSPTRILAKRYNVDRTTVQRIRRGAQWVA